MLAALTLATILQTKEDLVAEIVAAQRATMESGSYAMRMVDQTQTMGAMVMTSRSESDGTWQRPNLSRSRVRVTGRMGQDAMPELEMESFTAGNRVWRKQGETWAPLEIPGMASMQGAMSDPIQSLERTLGRADEVTVEEPQTVDGTRCKQYKVVLNGPAVAAMMQDERESVADLGEMPFEIEAEDSSMVMLICVGEEDHLVRKMESETWMRVNMGGVGGPQPPPGQGSMEMHQTGSITISRHGAAEVEIPESLRGEVRGEEN